MVFAKVRQEEISILYLQITRSVDIARLLIPAWRRNARKRTA